MKLLKFNKKKYKSRQSLHSPASNEKQMQRATLQSTYCSYLKYIHWAEPIL
jgi:hypothetical protein